MFVSAESGIFTGKKVANQDREIAEKSRRNLFRSVREDFIDMSHEFVLSANKIEWNYFGKEPSVCCSDKEAPRVPSYTLESKPLLRDTHKGTHFKRVKKANLVNLATRQE